MHKPTPAIAPPMTKAPRRRTVDDPPDTRVQPPTHRLAAAQIIRRLTRPNALDPRLAPTDRHMQRWAVGQGSGFPDAERALFVQSRLTPLTPEVDIATDQVVLSAPSAWRRFIVLWYRSDCSVDQLCEALRMGREKLFIERRIVLAYLLGRFGGVGIQIPIFGEGA
jgi:hypothetical protein